MDDSQTTARILPSVTRRPANAPRLGVVTLLALLAGASNGFTVIGLGELYGSEIVLPFAAALALIVRRDDGITWPRAGTVLLWSAGAMLTGYILADLLGETSTHDYLRGWARALSVLISSAALLVMLTRAVSSLWWYIIGTALGRFTHALLIGESIGDPTGWKLQFSSPLSVLISAVTGALPSIVSSALLVTLSAYNFLRDFRSLGAIILVLALLLWLSRTQHLRPLARSTWSVPTILGVSATLLLASGLVGWYLANNNQTDRQTMSTVGRIAALKIGARAIMASPVVGYGSWGQGSRDYANELYDELSTSSQVRDAGATELVSREATFSPHSQLLQAWMEGGLLAAAFFFICLVGTLRSLYFLVRSRPKDYLTPVALLVLLTGLWNILMSPFLGVHRLDIAVLVAMISLIRHQQTLPPETASSEHGLTTDRAPSARRFNIID